MKNAKTVKDSVLKDDVHYLTLQECADYLRMHYMTLWKLVKSGKGPPIRRFTSRCIRFPKDEFFIWAATRGDNECTQ